MKKINDGIAFGLGSLVGVWFYDHAGKGLVHGLAGNGDRVDGSGPSRGADG
jgi:hypothetical protein